MSRDLSWYRRMVGGPDLASCVEVGRQLQFFLDGQTDEFTAARVARHLELCRRCGLKADVYRQIKRSLARRETAVHPRAVARLQAFVEELVARGGETDDRRRPEQQ